MLGPFLVYILLLHIYLTYTDLDNIHSVYNQHVHTNIIYIDFY